MTFDDFESDFLSHHGVKGMRWGIRHDPVASRKKKLSKLKDKKKKNLLKLDKKRSKYDSFTKTRRGLIAKKAEIYLAKKKYPGLIGSHYLTKKRKMEYKIAKLERKDYRYDKRIEKLKNRMAQTDINEFESHLSHYGIKGMRWGIRHDFDRVSSGAKRGSKALFNKGKAILSKAFNLGKSAGRTSKKAYRRSRQKIRQMSQRRLDRNITKAINNGDAKRVNKYFSKMSDAQVNRALKRISDRSSVKYSLSQEKYRAAREYTDYLTADNNYMKAKNENYRLKHPYADRGQRAVENMTEKMLTRAAENYIKSKYPIFNGDTGNTKAKKPPRLKKR